ncbi:MAG: hypothetical protein M3R27_09475 [Bacteroidota bacterium]|nr:hypothetical protein [Bacteroidota bacterium]
MLNKLRFILPLLFLAPVSTFAQDFSYSNVGVTSATFSLGNHSVRKDGSLTAIYSPTWHKDSTLQNPIAYTSGIAPTVAAQLTIDCPAVPDSVWIRGSGSDSIDFAAKQLSVAPSAGTVHTINYPATTGSHVFAAAIVRFFKPYTINWEISFDNGITWKAAGATNNTLYVTRSAPQPETSNFKYWHTVYDLSCRNAQYKSLDTAIISNIWNEFIDHVVLNYKDDSLFYYKIMNSPNVSLYTLLKYRDAECYTFAQLFLAAIKIQGVVRTNNYVYITPMSNIVCGYTVNRFIVKDWAFGAPSASGFCSAFPYKNTYTTLLPPPYNAYNFITADVTDQAGIPGSCTVNPSSYFNNHQIVKLDGLYYDACYGVTFPTLVSIKTAAFSGWSFRYTASGTTNCYFTNDLSQSDLVETITTY